MFESQPLNELGRSFKLWNVPLFFCLTGDQFFLRILSTFFKNNFSISFFNVIYVSENVFSLSNDIFFWNKMGPVSIPESTKCIERNHYHNMRGLTPANDLADEIANWHSVLLYFPLRFDRPLFAILIIQPSTESTNFLKIPLSTAVRSAFTSFKLS